MRSGSTSLALALACGTMLAGGGEARGTEATPPQPTAMATAKATTPGPGAIAAAKEANAAALDAQGRKGSGWFSIRKPVQDLLLMKAAGFPWKADAERLAQLFAQKGEAVLPPRTMPSQRLIAVRQLRQLGLPTGELYRETVAAIRAEPPASRLVEGKRGVMSLSARTHVVFTMSDYYARTLAPAEFAHEVEAFARALEELAGREQLDDVTADIASEVLTARKVLRLPPDTRSKAVEKTLLAMQNAGGSWGGDEQSNAKVHHKAMAILALMEFGAEFQVGIDVL